MISMFTGIVETAVNVLSVTDSTLVISRPTCFESLVLGQSIAVNGACLSVERFSEHEIFFSVLSETFRRTNLETQKWVNVERAMPANGRFEGHVVLGHVDETIVLLDKRDENSGTEYVFSIPSYQNLLVEKGSIALNGVSLTLANVQDTHFSVYLIPLTKQHTNFEKLEKGEKVNMEYDYFAKLMKKKNEENF